LDWTDYEVNSSLSRVKCDVSSKLVIQVKCCTIKLQ